MERWVPPTVQLDARSHFNMTLNVSAVREVPWTASNGTRALIANLQLQQVQTLRTMHLTLGAFSLALALLTVHRIISDARRVAAVQVSQKKQRFGLLQCVHPAETFPLVLACGAVIQQTIFVSVQSTSLRSVLSNNCRGLAMITFPGYVTLVFGFEMTIRAFKYERFAPRGKWNTSICIGIISFLLLLTWMPTVIWPMFNRCFGSLVWFPVRYELIAICILSVLVFFFLLLAALISIQLMRTTKIDPNERIAASRMCYYLLISTLIYTLVIPVQIQAHRKDFFNALATSRIAEIALFTSGIFFAFFHLFLRVNATRMVIKPMKDEGDSSLPAAKRPKIRFFGPSDLEMNISGPLALQGGQRPDSRQGLIDVGPEKNRYEFDPEYFNRPERPLTPGSMKSLGPVDPTKWPLPPDPVQTSYFNEPKDGTEGLHKRSKSSYSLFPTRAEEIPRLPATVYSPEKPTADSRISKLALRRQTRRSSLGGKSVTDVTECFRNLTKPAPLFAKSHRRDMSTDSSATVQIGLRFSVAPATLLAAKCTTATREQLQPSMPILRRDNSDSSNESLGLPIQSPSSRDSSSTSISDGASVSAFPQPPAPVVASPTKTPPFPKDSSAYLQQQREKVLPPTPKAFASAMPTPPPATAQPSAVAALSGLRMNPVSPTSPASMNRSTTRSPTRSPTTRSPTARIPLGEGTMARSPPPNGWI
ncbi:hypothetical protein BU24DRAFT_450080 [Aaosphaeria arxii CBS 175.79]|uniref:Uncharacterized protein n=1 Tax=Aaosphaeria arxii CBS 175.79 TaxID=1450172 RepID=A0A6A5XSX4_9PLEO|nr:uncharacterized protein BU24DRAFT_450080 [Aaosphaeria arxii CBS 175.79]KAF2015344.1 hypothetical protein BU24DRAFT_450080 [Aaosphaeria arxii CBS 175.79]